NEFPPPADDACTVRFIALDTYSGLDNINETTIRNQHVLEVDKETFGRCINLENSRRGYEKAANDYLAAEIAEQQKILTAVQDSYLLYSKSNSILAVHFANERTVRRVRSNASATRYFSTTKTSVSGIAGLQS